MNTKTYVAVLLSWLTLGCTKNAQVEEVNVHPVARAWIANQPFPEDASVKPVAIVALEGASVEVTLDGSRSSDPDGKIVSYRWLSAATDPDAGTGRVVPEGEDSDWPSDEQKPKVTLSRGFHRFSLWVTDNDGVTSRADLLTVQIGEEDMLTPDEQVCIDGVIDMLADECKRCLCTESPACRAAVVESVCDETCWGLINCIALNCPDFAAMAAANDFSCVLTGCAMFTTGSMGAQAAGMCATACIDSCSAVEM
jgi:hypothetical protein